MTPEETVAAVRGGVARVGGAFMLDPATRTAGEGHGYRPWAWYYAGRGGVLDDVDADVVAAAMGFLPPTLVRKGWEQAAGVAAPRVSAQRYAEACAQWGRRVLADVPGLERLCALAERVAVAAGVPALPLFAGWRALPLPADPPARAAMCLHVLREHRGGAHLVAVLASGLSPLEAIVAGPEGEPNARFFGWPQPYPEVEPLRARRSRAEDLTDALVAPAYAVLDPDERAELAGLVAAVDAAVGGG